MLLSEINVAYYQRLMRDIRAAIAGGTFEDFRMKTRAEWARGRFEDLTFPEGNNLLMLGVRKNVREGRG